MKSDDRSPVTLDQMKGAVGSLLFLWSQIERALGASIDALMDGGTTKRPHGIAQNLDHWRTEIQNRTGRSGLADELCIRLTDDLCEALAARNLVCHGLIGYTARLTPLDEEACLTVELNGIARKLSWTELQKMLKWMSQASRLIGDLTISVLESDPSKSNALLQGWKDFPRGA